MSPISLSFSHTLFLCHLSLFNFTYVIGCMFIYKSHKSHIENKYAIKKEEAFENGEDKQNYILSVKSWETDDVGFCQIPLRNLYLLASFFGNVFHLELHCQCFFIYSVSKCGSSWISLILFLFRLYLCRLFYISTPFM